MYRELYEELGLEPSDVFILGQTAGWVRYQLPVSLRRHHSYPLCIGQIQKWFLLRLVSDESRIRLDASGHPEFDSWCWANYWQPCEWVIDFKREVYRSVLTELESLLMPASNNN
jgi:putative (di)nucleoside polyphosphate hydrolase